MNCKECGREINDNSVFCMYCGTEQDFEELGPESVPEEPVSVSAKKRDELAPGNTESALLTSLRSERWRRFTDPLTLSLAGISAVLLIAFLVLLFGRPAWEKNKDSSVQATETTVEETVRKNTAEKKGDEFFFFGNHYLQLSTGEQFDLMTMAEHSSGITLQWTSSNPKSVSVNEYGVITVLSPGSEATIEAVCLSDVDVSDSVRVVCLTHEAIKHLVLTSVLNDPLTESMTIAQQTIAYLPEKRNADLFWDPSLLESVEGWSGSQSDGMKILPYRVESYQMGSSTSGNLLRYWVYRSPVLGIIHKISVVEHFPDETVEILDCYFEIDGALNLVVERRDSTFDPTSINRAVAGEDRFYFTDDVMVRWRTCTLDNGIKEIVIGEKERVNNKSPYAATLYSEESEENTERFDQHEKRILNKAYKAYFWVPEREESYRYSGRVLNIQGEPIPGTKVTLIGLDFKEVEIFFTYTDDNGYFQFCTMPYEYRYDLRIEAPGYLQVRIPNLGATRTGIDTCLNPIRVILFEYESRTNLIEMLVTDAFNKSTDEGSAEHQISTDRLRLSGAEVFIREGIENRTGEIFFSANSNAYGIVTANLPSGAYTAEVIMPGYETGYYTVYSYPDCSPLHFCLPPDLSHGEFCIVLNRSDETADLDAHLFAPNGDPDVKLSDHVWFGRPEDQQGNRLAQDVTSGMDPEIITIANLGEGQYKYFVTDYSGSILGEGTSPQMAKSFVTVQIYSEDGLIRCFQACPDNDSLVWEVFEIRNRNIVPINRYYAGIPEDPWWIGDHEKKDHDAV